MIDKVLNLFKILFTLFSFVFVFYGVLELTYFLSFPKVENLYAKGIWENTSRALLNNMLLLSLFIIQHSAMASQAYKHFLDQMGLKDLSRVIYVSATAGVLLLTINYWQTCPQTIWNLDLNSKPIWYLYFGIHTTAWIIIYVANICADVTDLLGIKQIYYSINNLPDPVERKSYQLRKLNSHLRHPSFLGFLLIFWFFPLMTLDRFVLATILSAYMYIAWSTDGEDYNYQKYMHERKYHELRRLT